MWVVYVCMYIYLCMNICVCTDVCMCIYIDFNIHLTKSEELLKKICSEKFLASWNSNYN